MAAGDGCRGLSVMRNPAGKAIRFLAALILGIGLIWFGATRREAGIEDWPGVTATIAGVSLAFIMAFFLPRALFHIRGEAKLLAGQDVLGRWRVTPSDWARFHRFDDARSASNFYWLSSDFWFRRRMPAEGVDIIVGKHSLLVDGSYHVLRPRGIPELTAIRWLAPGGGDPDCLEFALRYPYKGGSSHSALRIPVPAAARSEALRVHGWFEPLLRPTPALAFRDVRRTYRICAAVLALCIAAALGGWLMAIANDFRIDESAPLTMVPLVLMLLGIIAGAATAILWLMTFLIARLEKRETSRRG